MSAANNNHLQENAASDDSDADFDTSDLEGSYCPISFNSDSETEPEPEADDSSSQPEPNNPLPILSNGSGLQHQNPTPDSNPNGISFSSLDLNGRMDEDEEEVERERGREATILRAFREDESRRNAPLTAENASRVMDAMRGVRFAGSAPEWADQVGEDRWVDGLRRLRGESTAATSLG